MVKGDDMTNHELLDALMVVLVASQNGYHASDNDIIKAAKAMEVVSEAVGTFTTTKIAPSGVLVNAPGINGGGTWLVGGIDISYARLVEKLGEPGDGDGEKVDAEWVIKFTDGTIATIHNYKDGVNYNGEIEGTPTEEITDWHVGGVSTHALDLVKELLGVE